MLSKIIEFSIRNKLIVGLFTFLLVVAGAVAFSRLPIDAIPDITNNQSQILTVCPTLATQEVEQFVTAPIENAVKAIPGVIELRSISRFGLSVVTVVFEEEIDMYLARQLLNEKLKMVEEMIPPGFGQPELAPISTGLGEILHYRIEPEPGYEHRYTSTELRTMQDWIVKRQLAGIPGVVEVNSFGGYLKQYEVALTPDRLRSFGISIQEVYEALSNANENSGGGYIEKASNAYFIRSEGLVKSLDDLRSIVVQNRGGVPVTIGDVGDVRFGSALRYGAVSHNGEGEIVLGIVMMLKGENAADVIERVKERLDQVAKTLPEGVAITTFLDRERLVNRTIDTVTRNLIEGALIVIFVLVLLVGNLRAGLVIASVIPLSMLFAIVMMRIFGVSANLMSLGAIDFGLIVDGAVIIVEATLYYLHTYKAPAEGGVTRLTQSEMDTAVHTASSRIMRSSVFGVIIILIVYLPILSLTGVEGKMFKPMAETVSFALIGALLLSLTYVPAMSAWLLSKKISAEHTWADKIIGFLERLYEPTLKLAFHWQKTVLAATAVVFAGSIWLFTTMGGEFIPTLDEGDIMMHGFLRPGTSLTQTLESHKLVQKTILDNFPDEVEQVISKIGSAEIPTDPMAIETADNIILLHDKERWTRAETKAELVALIEEKVQDVPGMAFEFTQPIKMRFDEMMTGVRSDVAVKIFGDNLDSLTRAGHRVEDILAKVPGIADLKVEQVEGLPQIVVRYNYARIARYGLHLRDLNETVRAAFAGATAGVVFEEEKRFDLVVRLDTARRRDLEHVRQLPVATPSGQLIPLSEVATVEYAPGAAQISRDDGKRRIVVSANVRGRDVEGVIGDMQRRIEKELKLPTGYYITYGGQFENLEAAKTRLSIAVPVALLLIFVLLYFAFHSLKESVLIFTAIPMSAIGGILALWLRDLPFSISAGVGFIALFGVAVLNGIVLIAYFNQLEKEGVYNVYERVRRGALVRLRPVLMTAAVASLGFLPMAISHGAGAEVQRPLATVVIGGLVTSTLLTLVVLPLLYALFFRGGSHRTARGTAAVLVLALTALGPDLQAQTRLSQDEALKLVLENHPAMEAASERIQEQTALSRAPVPWEPADIYHNIAADPDLGMFGTSLLGVSQTFPARAMVRARRDANREERLLRIAERDLTRWELVREVRDLYQHLSYLDSKRAFYMRLDTLYADAARVARRRYETGEVALVESRLADDKSSRLRLELETIRHETAFDQRILGQLLGLNEAVAPVVEPFRRSTFSLDDTVRLGNSPHSEYSRQAIAVAEAAVATEKANLSPALQAGLNAQYTANGNLYPGYQLGVSVPLFRKGWKARVEAAGIGTAIARAEFQQTQLRQQMTLGHLLHEVEKYEAAIMYYESEGRATAAELLRNAERNYRLGAIDYPGFMVQSDQALRIELEHLENLYGLNQTIIAIQTLLGE